MYFEACERLADERPELRETVKAVDELLEKNRGRDVSFDFLLDQVGISRRELQFIFDSLCDDPTFQACLLPYCKKHEQPLSELGECDLCDDGDEIETVHVKVIKSPTIQPSSGDMVMNRAPPRVLISYSHDSPEHAARVLRLSDQLREQGVDCRIDQYEPVPEEGWPVWMERQIAKADFVLCLCTEQYRRRFNDEGETEVGRGVSWEANLVRNAIFKAKSTNNRKYLILQFDRHDADNVPAPLQPFTVFVLKVFSLADAKYESLYRHLTAQPAVTMAVLGSLIHLEPRNRKSDGTPNDHRSGNHQIGWR